MTELQIKLKAAIAEAGGVRELVPRWGVTRTTIYNALKGHRYRVVYERLGIEPPPVMRSPNRRIVSQTELAALADRLYEMALSEMKREGQPATLARLARLCGCSWGHARDAMAYLVEHKRVKARVPAGGRNRKFYPVEETCSTPAR